MAVSGVGGSSAVDTKRVDLDDDDRDIRPAEVAETPEASPVEAEVETAAPPRPPSTARADLEASRAADPVARMQRDRIEATLDTSDVDLLAGAPPSRDPDATITPEEVTAPVELANDPGADYTRIDEWEAALRAESPDPTYSQRDYAERVADALSGRVEELGTLTDPERTRLLDRAHEHLYSATEIDGNGYVRRMTNSASPEARTFIGDDLAARSFVMADRAEAARASGLAPVHTSRAEERAQAYATQAGMINVADPAGFLDRLGPDASRFADALQLDTGYALDGQTAAVARHYYEAAGDASPGVRDAFRNTVESRLTGQPENPIAADAWRRLSATDPGALGQADLRAADALLSEHPPGSRGADILGEDHPAVVAAAGLTERRGALRDRLAEENAVYARAGFADDAPYSGGTAEERAAFLTDVAGRIDTLSPRAADQALAALEAQRAAGIDVPNGDTLERDLSRRLMVSTGVDLAARIDHQMETALEGRGWVGEGWDATRNALGLESGSEAVTEHLDRLRAARDELVALEDFEGTDAELSVALADRLDNVQRVAADASEAVGGYIETQDSLSTRGLGLLQAIGGGLEVVGGAGMIAAPEPLTSVAGVGVVALGVDDVQAGVRRVITGDDVPTFRAQLARDAALAAGASEGVADGVALAADIGPAGVSLARGVYRQAYRVFAGGAAGAAGDAIPLTDEFTDFMASRPRSAVNAVRGTGFTGRVADDAIAEMEAAGVRVVRDADARLDAMTGAGPGRGPLGGFNHETGEIYLRANATHYEWFHEATHARQWLEMGPEAYRAQTPLQREAHVFNEIVANGGQFNRLELRHAENYLQRLADREAHALVASGRFGSKREILDELRAQGVPDTILSRIPPELFGYRPRRGVPQ